MTQAGSDAKLLYVDSNRKVFEVNASEASIAEQAGWKPATAADVSAAKQRHEAGSASGQLKTAASGLASGAIDAATALPRAGSAIASHLTGTPDTLADMTGRNALETGAYVAGGGNLQGAQAAQEFAANERLRAQENPYTAAGATLAGNVVGASLGGLGALGGSVGGAVTRGLGGKVLARIAGAGVTGAVEGAPLNLVAAQDQAYIENRKLTGEQAMAALGTGALVGAGAGVAIKGLGEVFGAVKDGVSSYIARRAEAASPEAAQGEKSAMQKILRTSDENINKSVESTVQTKALPETAEYVREGVRGKNLNAIRDELHNGATTEMATATNDSLKAVQRLEDRVNNRGWKLGQIEAHSSTFAEDALQRTRAHAAAIRADIHETIAQLGNDAPKTLKGLAAQLDKNEMVIRGTDSAAKANLAMDQVRRDLLRTNQAFDSSAARVQNVDQADLMRVLTQKTGEHYETAQKFLMSPETWGAQGEAQGAVNTAYADLIRAKRNSLPAFTQEMRGAEYMGGGIARDQAIAHEGKLLGTLQNIGKPQGAVGQRALDDYLTSAKSFAEATQKYGLDVGDKQAVGSVQQALGKFETTLGEVTRKTGAIDQAEAWLTKSKEGTGLLGGGVLGSVVAGPIGTAAGVAAGAVLNPAKFMAQRLAVEEAASRAQRVIGTTLDGFFSASRKAMESTGEQMNAGMARVKASIPRAALPVATALELFQGRHATPEVAYKARVEEVLAANQNYGQRIRDNAGHVFGATADMDPHSVGAAVVSTTKAMQYLEGKIPAPLINPQSLTPNTSRYVPSRMEIQQYADLWTAVSRPLDIIKNLPTGAISPDQIQAIREVYPRLYEYVRQETMTRLRKMDQDGIEVPIRERIILDTALNLDGAGEPTFSARFAQAYGPAMKDGADEEKPGGPRPHGGGKSEVAKRTSTTTESMLGGES